MKKAMTVLAGVVLFVAAVLPGSAQDQSPRAQAEELLNLVNMKETLERSSAMIKQMVSTQVQKMNPPALDPTVSAKMASHMEKMMDMISNELSWDRVKDEYITVYAEIFTQQELKDITAFYKTPSGQALIKKQPEVMKRSMELSQKMTDQVMPKIQAMTKAMKDDILSSQPPKPEAK